MLITIHVRVIRARSLISRSDFSPSSSSSSDSNVKLPNPFCNLQLGEEREPLRTSTKNKTTNPKWNLSFYFQMINGIEFPRLEATVWDKDPWKKTVRLIGSVVVDLNFLLNGKIKSGEEIWFSLLPHSPQLASYPSLGELQLEFNVEKKTVPVLLLELRKEKENSEKTNKTLSFLAKMTSNQCIYCKENREEMVGDKIFVGILNFFLEKKKLELHLSSLFKHLSLHPPFLSSFLSFQGFAKLEKWLNSRNLILIKNSIQILFHFSLSRSSDFLPLLSSSSSFPISSSSSSHWVEKSFEKSLAIMKLKSEDFTFLFQLYKKTADPLFEKVAIQSFRFFALVASSSFTWKEKMGKEGLISSLLFLLQFFQKEKGKEFLFSSCLDSLLLLLSDSPSNQREFLLESSFNKEFNLVSVVNSSLSPKSCLLLFNLFSLLLQSHSFHDNPMLLSYFSPLENATRLKSFFQLLSLSSEEIQLSLLSFFFHYSSAFSPHFPSHLISPSLFLSSLSSFLLSSNSQLVLLSLSIFIASSLQPHSFLLLQDASPLPPSLHSFFSINSKLQKNFHSSVSFSSSFSSAFLPPPSSSASISRSRSNSTPVHFSTATFSTSYKPAIHHLPHLFVPPSASSSSSTSSSSVHSSSPVNEPEAETEKKEKETEEKKKEEEEVEKKEKMEGMRGMKRNKTVNSLWMKKEMKEMQAMMEKEEMKEIMEEEHMALVSFESLEPLVTSDNVQISIKSLKWISILMEKKASENSKLVSASSLFIHRSFIPLLSSLLLSLHPKQVSYSLFILQYLAKDPLSKSSFLSLDSFHLLSLLSSFLSLPSSPSSSSSFAPSISLFPWTCSLLLSLFSFQDSFLHQFLDLNGFPLLFNLLLSISLPLPALTTQKTKEDKRRKKNEKTKIEKEEERRGKGREEAIALVEFATSKIANKMLFNSQSFKSISNILIHFPNSSFSTLKKAEKLINAMGETLNPEDPRFRIAYEIFSSEFFFLKFLRLTKQIFVDPLRKSGIISVSELQMIFSSLDIEILIDFHTNLLIDFQSKIENWNDSILFSIVFLQSYPFLKVYKEYCISFEKLHTRLKDLKAKNERLRTFIQDQTDSHRMELNSLDLESILVMPVQRAPRYSLLFRELLKKTKENHADYLNTKEAVEGSEEINRYIDLNIDISKTEEKVIQLEEKLKVPLFLAHRRFVKEGVVLQFLKTGGMDHKIYYFLFNDIILLMRRTKIRKLTTEGEVIYSLVSKFQLEEIELVDQVNIANVATYYKPGIIRRGNTNQIFIVSSRSNSSFEKEDLFAAIKKLRGESIPTNARGNNIYDNFFDEVKISNSNSLNFSSQDDLLFF